MLISAYVLQRMMSTSMVGNDEQLVAYCGMTQMFPEYISLCIIVVVILE